ncbi:YwaF family protein [Mycoplasmopsis pulmonis]|uniref:YwaF family protein n=1 Tax=Mycoplasmopsis pulmonis TaxID=2107 RepID=UPI001004E153|nr:YwaF family protein [Mycoplasmopsis pulmonis]MDZ7293741.1 YwaF family protein [Mycoplasmopsis pulmonis]VEU67840.1 Predicted integral membrane protein [Mycoplasmopsis pulmonis]
MRGFFKWQGNQLSFEGASFIFFNIFWVSFLVIAFGLWLFKDKVFQYFNSIDGRKTLSPRNIFIYSSASLILVLNVVRLYVLIGSNYPNKWEYLPLHLCRILVFSLMFCLYTKKIRWINYIGYTSIISAFVGLVLPDLSNNEYWQARGGVSIGIDSYIYWDFLLIHTIGFFVPIFVFIAFGQKITFSNYLAMFFVGFSIALSIFVLNYILSSNSDPSWQSNWFYLSIDSINTTYSSILGKASSWPFHVFTFSFIGFAATTVILIIYFLQDKVRIIYVNKKLTIKIIPSFNWMFFVDSYKEFSNKFKKVQNKNA